MEPAAAACRPQQDFGVSRFRLTPASQVNLDKNPKIN